MANRTSARHTVRRNRVRRYQVLTITFSAIVLGYGLAVVVATWVS